MNLLRGQSAVWLAPAWPLGLQATTPHKLSVLFTGLRLLAQLD